MSTQLTAKQFFEQDATQNHLKKTLGEKSKTFTTSVLGIVASSTALQKCEPASIYQCALVATTLDLPINQNLGYAYIIPYGGKAQFQIGYKGFIQLAQRSNKFININCVPVFENDTDEDVRKRLTSFLPQSSNGKLVGYTGYFKLLNGYEQILAMSIEDLRAHGSKYSKSFGGLWTSDFESMARKTVIKLMLQRFAPMSVEMLKGATADQAVINDAETMDVDYIDSTQSESIDEINATKERERVIEFIEKAKTKKELDGVKATAQQLELMGLYNDKLSEINGK